MSFPKTTPFFYKRSELPRQRGKELSALSLNRSGEPSTSPAVPTPSWVSSKLEKSRKDAKQVERAGKQVSDRRQGGGRTYDSDIKPHFAPSTKIDR
jgi:hypothetical protein